MKQVDLFEMDNSRLSRLCRADISKHNYGRRSKRAWVVSGCVWSDQVILFNVLDRPVGTVG